MSTEPVTPALPAGSLAGKRALITGSSRGIGADTARYLAAAGAKVAINYRNKEARALKLVSGIEPAMVKLEHPIKEANTISDVPLNLGYGIESKIQLIVVGIKQGAKK